MRHIKFTESLFLNDIPIKKEVKETKPAVSYVNHIRIYDRSWSMSGDLRQLIEDLIVDAKNVNIGDTYTIGYFSGEGQYEFFLKGFKVTEDRDFSVLENIIRQHSRPIGTTCFSEILADSKNIVKNLSAYSETFSLCFFTDGYPVVSSYSKELKGIFAALGELEGLISSSVFVGYGNYYNKDLMKEMAEKIGGSLVHSKDLESFKEYLKLFKEDALQDIGKRIEVEIDYKDPIAVFTLSKYSVNLYSVSDGKIKIPANTKNVFVLGDKGLGKLAKMEDKHFAAKSTQETLLKACFGSAFTLCQKAKVGLALEVLGFLGDVELIDAITNAYTNDEYGKTEDLLIRRMSKPSSRFAKGRDTNHLPPKDAFCILDVVSILMNEGTYFYPYHDNFKYSRIGRKSELKEGFSKFVPEDNVKCSFSSLTWNEKLLNLSVLANIQGKTKLLEKEGIKPNDVGLLEDYPVNVFRNYTIIKDGFPNVKSIPVSMSQATFDTLQLKGLLVGQAFEEGKIYDLDFGSLPVINRAMAEGRTSATELSKKVIEQLKLKAIMKVLKWYKKSLEEGKKAEPKLVTEKQKHLLESNGIKPETGVYSPGTVLTESADHYFANTFEIKVKSLASLPSVKAVTAKLENGKKLTLSDSFIKAGLDVLEKAESSIDTALEDHNKRLKEITKYIQETKFAVLLGQSWFDEFKSREECSLEIDGYHLTFKIDAQRCDF